MSIRQHTLPLLILLLMSMEIRGENAPVTSAAIIPDATPGGAVIAPVTVTGFVSIGSFILTLRYRIDMLTYDSATLNNAFPGMTVTQSVSGSIGKLVIHWPETPGGVTLPDQTSLLDIHFTYITGTAALSWAYTSGNVCIYSKYSNGSYMALNDNPKSSYYINGTVSNRTAPVTTAATIVNAIPGMQYDVPVTVTGFTTISSMYLKIDFDTTALTYLGYTPNTVFGGSISSGVSHVAGPIKRLTIGWWGGGLTLADGTTVFTMHFTYNNNPGMRNHSLLSWFDDGPGCEYADNNGYVLIDRPTEDFYKSGLVCSQYAPQAWLPVITAAAQNSALSLPVKVKDFEDIHSLSLTMEYDTSAMSYTGFTPHSAFGGDLTVTNTGPVGSKRQVVITWPGPGPLTLPDSATLATLHVGSKTGGTALAWVTSDPSGCRFNDNIGNAFYDLPKTTYYQDGLLATQVAPLTIAGQVSPSAGQQVTIPVLVYRFSDIGTWNLELDYDPGVLTYISSTVIPTLGGTFQPTLQGAGRLTLAWSGDAASLPDSTVLVSLLFDYNGGETTLAWHDNGSSCHYAASATDSSLYDKPTGEYYINGYAGPSPLVAAFTADNLLPALNQAVIFTNQSTGSPDAWQWIIQPDHYQFVNGTGSTSENPQVAFTQGGAYTVTLIATRGTTAAARMKKDYIHASIPGLWTGWTSTAWYTTTNWHNHLVPGAAVDVLIPGSPEGNRFPVFPGDLQTGVNCLNITLESPAEITVEGEFIVGPGTQMFVTGTGQVVVSFQ